MSLNQFEQITVRIELILAPRTLNLQPSRSDISTNIIQTSSTSGNATTSSTLTENSINSLIQTPSQRAAFKKEKDGLNVKRSEACLKESHEFMKYLQKKYNLSTTQPADILGREISRMKKCENNVTTKSPSSS